MAYIYRGANRDMEPEPEQLPPGVFNPAKCGTLAGYRQHQKHGTPTCDYCKAAQADYSRDYKQKVKNGHQPHRGFRDDACGTDAGYSRHKRHNVTPCDPCNEAHRTYISNYRKRRKEAANGQISAN